MHSFDVRRSTLARLLVATSTVPMVPVSGSRRGCLPDGLNDVVDAGDDASARSRLAITTHATVCQTPDSGRMNSPIGERLNQRLELAAPAGGDHAAMQHDEPQERDPDLAHQDHDRHPPGRSPSSDSPISAAPNSALSAIGSASFPNSVIIAVAARQRPVETIGHHRDREDDERHDAPTGFMTVTGEQREQRTPAPTPVASLVSRFAMLTSRTIGGVNVDPKRMNLRRHRNRISVAGRAPKPILCTLWAQPATSPTR